MTNTNNTAITATVATQLIGNREILSFDDGHLEIEDPMINFQQEGDKTLEHVSLDKAQVKALRDFLNATL